MARFYGTIQGARGPASRLGHPGSGLQVTAQSYQGDIVVGFSAVGDEDHVWIEVRDHSNRRGVCLYNGPVRALLDDNMSLVQREARRKLEEEFA